MYKDKNDIGGYHPEGSFWMVGSLFASEGERLYDLVRRHKPKKIIEVGTRQGCSTIHLATACKHNGFGIVYAYDVEDIHVEWPEDLKKHIRFNHMDYFQEKDKVCDMLFEDGAHTTGFTSRVLKETLARVIAVHDYNHRSCLETVQREALRELGQPDEVYQEEESDCGLAIWIK